MFVFRRILALGVVCLSSFGAAQLSAQLSDQLAAERVLGPHWRQIARASGMIFSGTVLQIEGQPADKGHPLPLVLTTFHVDRDIAGVRREKTVTVREWAGAWSMQRPMTRGQRLLIFEYPPSRLGLTSPVGGRLGQVVLDPRGEIVAIEQLPFPPESGREDFSRAGADAAFQRNGSTARLKPCPPENRSFMGVLPKEEVQPPNRCATQDPTSRAEIAARPQSITLAQLERAIRAVRRKSVRKHKE